MIKQKQQIGLLFDAKYRDKGEADIRGEHIKWDAGYVVTYIPFESTQVQKRVVDPDMAESVDKALEEIHWGALITLEFRGKYIVNVTVEADPFADVV